MAAAPAPSFAETPLDPAENAFHQPTLTLEIATAIGLGWVDVFSDGEFFNPAVTIEPGLEAWFWPWRPFALGISARWASALGPFIQTHSLAAMVGARFALHRRLRSVWTLTLMAGPAWGWIPQDESNGPGRALGSGGQGNVSLDWLRRRTGTFGWRWSVGIGSGIIQRPMDGDENRSVSAWGSLEFGVAAQWGLF